MNKQLRKLRKDPVAFFRDARFGWLAGPLPRILSRPRIHAMLLDPEEALSRIELPWVSRSVAAVAARARRRRLALLAKHGRPKVSVVMPAHDAEATIERALSSVLEQSYRELELIVVDDGSRDATLELVRRAASADPRVVVVASPRNRGVAGARNLGLHRATGDFVTFHDADDYSHPERVERQLAALLTHPEAVVCLCNYRREDDQGRPVTINGRLVGKSLISMLFRRETVLSRIGYLTDLRISEETEYFERMKLVFGRGAEVHLFATLYFARFSPSSLLFSDGDVSVLPDGAVRHERSEGTDRALARLRERLRAIGRGEASPYVGFEP